MDGNFGVDLEGLTAEERRELMAMLTERACEVAEEAERLMPEVGRENAAGERCVDGLGEVKLRMTPAQRWIAKVVHGVDVRDPGAARFLRNHREYEGCFVKHVGPCRITMPGTVGEPREAKQVREPKFFKVYP